MIKIPDEQSKINQKKIKISIFAVFFIGVSYFFGYFLQIFGQSYNIFVNPPYNWVFLIWIFLISINFLLVFLGYIAGLVRHLSVSLPIIICSAIAILTGWGNYDTKAVGFLFLYALAAVIYTESVEHDLNLRIKFTTLPIRKNRNFLILTIVLLICSSFYFGFSLYIEKEGTQFAQNYINDFSGAINKNIMEYMPLDSIPPDQEVFIMGEVENESQKIIQELYDKTVVPFATYIPLLFSVFLFTPLVFILKILQIISDIVIEISFFIFRSTKVYRIKKEMKEVERITLD